MKSFIAPIVTRWFSYHDSIERYLELHDLVEAYAQAHKGKEYEVVQDNLLTVDEVRMARSMVDLLAFIKHLLLTIQTGSRPGAMMIMPVLNAIYKDLHGRTVHGDAFAKKVM